MKILFDSQMFYRQRYGGVTRYFSNLITSLEAGPDFDAQLSIIASDNEYIRSFLQRLNEGERQRLAAKWPFLNKKMKTLNRLTDIKALRFDEYDVFHPTYYHPYFLSHVRKPYVITVHDMIHELYPEYFSPKDRTREKKKKVICTADHIIAISQNTKKDILHFYDVDPEKISVIYHGYSTIKTASETINPSIEVPYLLFVGVRSGYKNFELFIKVLSPLLESHPELKVICVGGGSFTPSELEFFQVLGISTRLNQVDLEEGLLHQYYAKALFFVFPSLYEGFGFPVLEAFEAGCPIALSNTSSLPEVGGEAGAYFNPRDAESMRTVFERMISDADYRRALVSKGFEQLNHFTQEECTKRTMRIYRNLSTRSYAK